MRSVIIVNIQPPNDKKNKKYTAKSPIKSVKSVKSKEDTSQYNLTKEEVAKSVINSLKDAQKYLRGEVKGRPIDDLLKEAFEYIEEEKRNGRY